MQIARFLFAAGLVVSNLAPAAGIKIENAWLMATLPGQKVAGGFMDITAEQDMALVGASSPLAQAVELHRMRMAADGMEMRAFKSLRLPKGKTVNLAPSGLHAMLIGLKAPIKAGDLVPMSLAFEDGHGGTASLDVTLKAATRLY
ncbi:MAG: copper chaperone PCu(A)C [Gallionellaceae bacterium]|nr:copper chaperone PCu(A)C [Gallionellaceae bacterium]